MSSAQAVFFDLDDTLLDDNRSWRTTVALTCAELETRHPATDWTQVETAYLDNSARLWAAYGSAPRTATGSPTARSLRRGVWQTVLESCSLDAPALADDTVDTYDRHRRETYACFADAQPSLQRLKGRLPLGVISNGPSEGQREKLDLTGLTPFFDLIVVSSDLGVGKPEAAIFQFALNQLGLDPAGVWHVGDNLVNDVGGARNAGLRSVWLNRHRFPRPENAPSPDHEIETLTELIELLGLE